MIAHLLRWSGIYGMHDKYYAALLLYIASSPGHSQLFRCFTRKAGGPGKRSHVLDADQRHKIMVVGGENRKISMVSKSTKRTRTKVPLAYFSRILAFLEQSLS